MGQLFAIEIIYRGVFQKTLAKNIARGIVLAAHNEGRPGISFGRYGDSSELRAGANWYFRRERGLRFNAEWLHLDHSPVGYTAVPYPVGGNGNVFHTNLEMNF